LDLGAFVLPVNQRLQADLRRKSSSFSLQPQLEQLRQQKSNTATPAVMSTASTVPNENKECPRKCMLLTLILENSDQPDQILLPGLP
jgi:hypothetical protein